MLEFDEADELFVGDAILNEFYSCTDCGLCCRFFSDFPIYKMEIASVSSFLKISSEQFKQNYTKRIGKNVENTRFSLKTPCPFLNGNVCRIYDHRFLVCRTFPLFMNLTKNEAILSGIYLCPQATQFYEGLLEFYKKHYTELFHRLIEKEKDVLLDEKGMEIKGKDSLFSPYLDWLYSTK
jgi:Fe-S-cluster containining protein